MASEIEIVDVSSEERPPQLVGPSLTLMVPSHVEVRMNARPEQIAAALFGSEQEATTPFFFRAAGRQMDEQQARTFLRQLCEILGFTHIYVKSPPRTVDDSGGGHSVTAVVAFTREISTKGAQRSARTWDANKQARVGNDSARSRGSA